MAAAISRISNSHLLNNPVRFNFASSDVGDLNQHISYPHTPKRKCCFRNGLVENDKRSLSRRWLEVKRHWPPFNKARRIVYFVPFASGDEGMAVNGTTNASSEEEMAEMRVKLNQSLQGENLSSFLVQSIHDAARAIELAILEHSSSSKASWFSKAWLGVDKNAWIKQLSYQAAVNALLQAAIEISSRGDGRDRDTNISVQRSLSRQCAPLENIIQEELSAKQPAAYDWFWTNQHPVVVKTFVDFLERDPRFTAATALFWKRESSGSGTASDTALLMLSLSCLAAVKKLGSTKLSCSQFFSMIPDTVGRLMDMLIDFFPMQKAYYSLKDIGLRREFLFHFGPRVAVVKYNNDHGAEERAFWIDLAQSQLQKAIDREKIWSRLTTCESIEVLEKDLAIFGFFIALGRSTQLFLSANGVSAVTDQIEGIVRYLIGGSVLYYPQLASISSYQLFVEVVCEELDWLPFYGSNLADLKQKAESEGKNEVVPNREAIPIVLDVCSYWMTSFIKYSAWLENPSNIKAARFLSRGHSKLTECMKEVEKTKNRKSDDVVGRKDQRSESYAIAETELDSFDKALESVEEALIKLEDLLQELHVSNLNSGKENLKAACSDLERIRKLKKEAEFLEASFRAKAASLGQVDADGPSLSSVDEQRPYSNKKVSKASSDREANRSDLDRIDDKRLGFLGFLLPNSTKKMAPAFSTVDKDVTSTAVGNQDSELNEIHRFELLRHELIELEKRVQRSTSDSQPKEAGVYIKVVHFLPFNPVDNRIIAPTYIDFNGNWHRLNKYVPKQELEFDEKEKNASVIGNHMMVHGQKNSVISKSIEKIKETGTDVWQGTQLLAIDVAAATVLLKRQLTGDELTEKEKKALQRTLTDLASVVPIGFLMLLPVTAVGHAAMLTAIQRYVPALIPSTYGSERLALLRQLEKVKELDTTEVSSEELAEAIRPSNTNP